MDLISASHNGDLQRVLQLIKEGTNINIQDSYGYTALMEASYLDRSEISTILIEAGANTDLINNNNNCALYYSLNNKNDKISNLLLKNIKNFNKKYLGFKNNGITFFYLLPFIKKSKKCPINKIPDDLIGLLLKF